MSVDLDKILREDSGFYSNIRKCKDLYSRYIKVLKDKYGANWQDHMDLEEGKKKDILKEKVSYEDCNRYVADLLLTDCRQNEILDKVCKSINFKSEPEIKLKDKLKPCYKKGDKKYKAMRYWHYLPEYFYDYQSRYDCDFGLKYQEPEGVEKSKYLLEQYGKYTSRFVEEYRDNMREAIADFLDNPANIQIKEQLYDDYKYYARNCQIRTKTGNFIADTTWDKGKLPNDNIEDQELYKYIMALNPYAFDSKSYGILRVAHKTSDGNMENWGVALKDAKDLACLQGEKDLYMSPNLFKSITSYTKDDVSRLNAFFVDLDFYKIPKFKRYTAKSIRSKIKLAGFGSNIGMPEPSLCIDTGRGLCLVWLIESMSVTEKSQKYWEWIEERLVEQFKDYGVDQAVKDTPRILRMLGSINSKSGRVVQIIEGDLDNPIRYSISTIHEALDRIEEAKETLKSNKQIQEIPRNSASKSSKPRKREGLGTSVNNMRSVFLNRVYDLEQVVKYRRVNGCIGIEETGWRDKLIFLYCLHLCYAGYSVEQAINRALKLNQKMNIPLKERKITSKKHTLEKVRNAYFRSVKNKKAFRIQDDGVYRYSTNKIMEMIELTEEEQANIKFSTLLSEEARKDRKKLKDAERYNRNKEKLKAEGHKFKKDKMAEMREKVKELLAQGMTQKAIAEKLGVSTKTVQRRVKELQNENIIEFSEVKKATVKSMTEDKDEVYADSVGMPITMGVEKYRGFDKQTVG